MSDDLGDILRDMTDEQTNKDRPFTGQSHTSQGERGKAEVRGIRFRDLADCMVRAIVLAVPFEVEDDDHPNWELHRRAEDGTLNYNDLYDLELDEVDPLALVQNLCIEVERAMGIYPNVPRPKDDAE